MKYAFISIVSFITCSVCVLGDLEIFPGFNLDQQHRKYQRLDESYAPLYVDRRRHSLYPQLEQEYFGSGQSQPEFRERIKAKFRQIQELLKRRRKQLIEKTENAYQDLVVPDLPDREEEDYGNHDREFDRFTYPNRQILDDVKPYSQNEDEDFTFHDDEMVYNNGESNHNIAREFDKHRDQSDNAKNTATYGIEKFEATPLDDPSEFAYAPPDPRFLEDSAVPDIKTQRGADSIGIDGENDEVNSAEPDYRGFYEENIKAAPDPKQWTDKFVRVVAVRPNSSDAETAGVYIIAVVAGISAAATVGLIAFGIGWYNLQKHVKNASDVEYPAYGITGPNKDVSPSGDRRLAQSAQMYHYQHQKQQIIAMERAAGNDRHGSMSEADSEDENEEGDYTVYECPGLAPTGEMEVKNPLFQDDPTPAQTPGLKPSEEVVQKK